MVTSTRRYVSANLRATCTIAIALVVTGCTSSFIYQRLDTLAGWYLRSLVSLDDSQRTQLHDWLTQTLDWHRQFELDRYAQFLRDLSGELAQPGSATVYEQKQQRFDALWDDLIVKVVPDATRLLLSLSPTQAEEFVNSLAEKSRQRAAETTDVEDWRYDRIKGLTRALKRWTGSASPSQKALIAAAVAQIEPTQTEWLASQSRWRNALRESLAAAPLSDAATQRIQLLLLQPHTEWTEQYRDKERRNRQRYLELVVSLDAVLTAQQRERLRAELLKLATQLEAIAKKST